MNKIKHNLRNYYFYVQIQVEIYTALLKKLKLEVQLTPLFYELGKSIFYKLLKSYRCTLLPTQLHHLE